MNAELRRWLEANWFRAGLLATAILSVIFVAFYFLIFTPSRERDRDQKIEACLSAADISYRFDWAAQCQGRKQKTDCTLPGVVADGVEQRARDARTDCYRRYPR